MPTASAAAERARRDTCALDPAGTRGEIDAGPRQTTSASIAPRDLSRPAAYTTPQRVTAWIGRDNSARPHQALGYGSPAKFRA